MFKIRLQFLVTDKCGEMTRNEAHVRLVSSVRYTTKALLWVVVFNLALTAAAILLSWFSGRSLHLGDPARIVLFNTGFACLLIWDQRTILKFFHYQRVREIVYVLEMAHFADGGTVTPTSGGFAQGLKANPADAPSGADTPELVRSVNR